MIGIRILGWFFAVEQVSEPDSDGDFLKWIDQYRVAKVPDMVYVGVW